MIKKLLKTIYFLTNRDKIPRLPSRMYANHFDDTDATQDDWRVLARLGARDPQGIKVAMRRHGVSSPTELAKQLEHYQAQRRVGERWRRALIRLSGGKEVDPHHEEIKRIGRKLNWREKQHEAIRQRVKHINSKLQE